MARTTSCTDCSKAFHYITPNPSCLLETEVENDGKQESDNRLHLDFRPGLGRGALVAGARYGVHGVHDVLRHGPGGNHRRGCPDTQRTTCGNRVAEGAPGAEGEDGRAERGIPLSMISRG